jgi:hypothetical protein
VRRSHENEGRKGRWNGIRCPVCGKVLSVPLARHFKGSHGEEALRAEILKEKRKGTADAEIGSRYGISFRYLERVITEATGANISVLTHPRHNTDWEPRNFRLETTTVWSFKNRGRWATHDGRYRGNWSPYIPRNLILRYTQANNERDGSCK